MGCFNKSAATAKVLGSVIYKGDKVTQVTVTFIREIAPKEKKEKGIKDIPVDPGPDGNFFLVLVPGTYKVTVKVKGVQQAPPRGKQFKPLIPPKYADPEKTPLTVTVKEGDNTVECKLED